MTPFEPIGYSTAVAGMLIVTFYWLISVGVAPFFITPRSITRVGGVFFFMLCGLTHLELVGHYLAGDDLEVTGDLASLHMAAMMVPQAWAVVAFSAGLYADGRIGVEVPPIVDRLLVRIAAVRWMNWIADRVNRRLRRYAAGYGVIVLALTFAGI